MLRWFRPVSDFTKRRASIPAEGSGHKLRKKELKLVVTFHTTADAMGMEQMCREEGLPGRLIPVPRTISAGCGLSWCAEVEDEDCLVKAMEEHHLEKDGIYSQLYKYQFENA